MLANTWAERHPNSNVFSILSRALYNLLRLVTAPLWYLGHRSLRPRSRWVHLRLRSRIVEMERPLPAFLQWVPGLAESRPTSLTLIRELVDFIVNDERIEGVVFDIPPLAAGWATCTTLRQQLVRLRESGRNVVVYLSQGGGNRELYVASAASRILASPHAQITPLGLAASVTYFKGLLEKAGVEVEVIRRAEYKTAAEPATRDTMSEEQREQTSALLATVDGALRQGLATRPGMTESKLEQLFSHAMMSAEMAVGDGLLDDVCYEDELPSHITAERKVTPLCRAPRYYGWHKVRLFTRVAPERFIAVISVHGTIESPSGTPRGAAKFRSAVNSLRAARKNPMVAGVVLHVDSPGGSALTSDLIHREVQRLKELKPVVASFGDVAASGGYYVAASADAVVAQPLSITGSIGVVSARMVTKPLLDKLGVNVETVRTAPHADMLQRPGRLLEAETAILEREIEAFYRTFVGVVAEGRGRDKADIERLARGRVWSGQDALEQGLVDRLGGLDTAIDVVRERLEEKMSAGAVRKLSARHFRVSRLDLPPAEPPRLEKAAWWGLKAISPGVAELVRMGMSGESAFFFATDVPEIR